MGTLRFGMRKRGASVMAAAAALALGACAEEAAVEAPPEGVVPGLEIADARLMLPAVSGNPGAVYFDLTYNGERGLSINGATVEGAEKTEVHDTMEYNFKMTMGETGPVAMPKGETIKFEPGGKHVMAFDLDEGITPGSTVEVELRVSGGDRHKFSAEVKAAGDER